MSDTKERVNDAEFERLLWFLLGGSRGGENRARILDEIRRRPSNLNRLAKAIGIDYRSVQHHMIVLQRNNLVISTGLRYGVVYSVHPFLLYHFETFVCVCRELGYSVADDVPSSSVEECSEKMKLNPTPQI